VRTETGSRRAIESSEGLRINVSSLDADEADLDTAWDVDFPCFAVSLNLQGQSSGVWIVALRGILHGHGR
jgi:hypothetical protein